MNTDILEQVHHYYTHTITDDSLADALEVFRTFLSQLERGEIRAAEKHNGKWSANRYVKEGILLGFRLGKVKGVESGVFHFSDLDTYPTRHLSPSERIRVVPGGSSVRGGAYIANDVIIMPPAFVNVGAYVGSGSMVDSHALVGSCAQIGSNVHLSAGAQIGGVLEPIGETPVIVEDGALIGGNCGIYEGVQVGENAVISAGCVITSSTPVYDLVKEEIYRASEGEPLKIPANAVVIGGTRGLKGHGDFARQHKLHLPAAIIVKYRDASTDAKTALEDTLRQ